MKPEYIVVTGPNGAGKSSISKRFDFPVYDPDCIFEEALKFVENSKEYGHLDLKGKKEFAGYEVAERYKKALEVHLKSKTSLVTESHINHLEEQDIELFKKNGYEITLVVVCLNSINQSKERVIERVMSGGHDVDDLSIQYNFNNNYQYADSQFNRFNRVLLIDNSESIPKDILEIENGRISLKNEIPSYFPSIFPNMMMSYNQQKSNTFVQKIYNKIKEFHHRIGKVSIDDLFQPKQDKVKDLCEQIHTRRDVSKELQNFLDTARIEEVQNLKTFIDTQKKEGMMILYAALINNKALNLELQNYQKKDGPSKGLGMDNDKGIGF